jgi:hypothetical protein
LIQQRTVLYHPENKRIELRTGKPVGEPFFDSLRGNKHTLGGFMEAISGNLLSCLTPENWSYAVT